MKCKSHFISRLIARFSHFSFRFVFKGYAVVHSLLTGFWLGIMGEKSFDAVDDLAYTRKLLYSDEIYNTSGLFDWEREMIEKALRAASSNRKQAAKYLGIGERTLYRKLKEYDIK